MEIRAGEPSDTDAICSVARAAWHAAYDDILGSETVDERTDEWYDPEVVRDYFDEPAISVYVAGDPVVGYAFTRHDEADDRLHLTAIYVHPDRWGEGIGSRLLGRVESDARERGRETVALVVLDGNERARSFYEGHGYEQVREREDTVDEDVGELVYEKQL